MLRKALWNLTWLIWRPLLELFGRFHIGGFENIKHLRPPFIFAIATHGHRLDPWIIGAALPFNSIFYPIRYVTAEQYINMPILGSFLKAYGAFPVYRGIGLESSLQVALDYLKRGKIVGIFPEGKLVRAGDAEEFTGKPGAAYLSLKSGLPIVPVRLYGTRNLTLFKFLFRKVVIQVNFGRPYQVETEDLKAATTDLMLKIESSGTYVRQ